MVSSSSIDRARPAVRHDQRQRVLVRRLHVDEVDVQPVDLGLELRQRVQSRFAPAPVVLGRPVAGELLDRRQLHALGPIGDELLGRPASRLDAAAQLFDLALRDVDSERADLGLCACARGVTHDRFPSLIAFHDSGCGGTHADLADFNETFHVRADTCVAAIVNRDTAKAQAEVESAVPSAGCVDRAARQNCRSAYFESDNLRVCRASSRYCRSERLKESQQTRLALCVTT